jgi:hypothetical protein
VGKGSIKSYIGDGEYSVQLTYSGRDRVAAQIDALNVRLLALADEMAKVQKEIEDLLVESEAQLDPESIDPDKPIQDDPGDLTDDPGDLTDDRDDLADEPDKDSDGPFKDPEEPFKDPEEPFKDPEEPSEDDPPLLDGDSTIEGTITDS